jgi:hypothetical protein
MEVCTVSANPQYSYLRVHEEKIYDITGCNSNVTLQAATAM